MGIENNATQAPRHKIPQKKPRTKQGFFTNNIIFFIYFKSNIAFVSEKSPVVSL